MKVVHLVPAMEQGGVETVVCALNRAMVRLGWESVVVSSGGRLLTQIAADGGRHLTLDVKSKNPLSYFSRARRLKRLLEIEKPDLVCAHSRVPAWLFVWANRGLGIKWITYAHGANSVSRYSAVMTKGDLVVTPSRFLAEFLMTNYGLSEGKIRVIWPAVDAQRFDPERLDREFIAAKRREWGIRDGDHVVMAVGRLTPVKGLEDLIRTTPPEQKLVLVGDADRRHLEYAKRLKALAGPNVVFAGRQEKIPECLSIADEVVSANTVKPESFGLSIAEAYAMNRPVRARRFGGVAEIMSAVESSGMATPREAILKLCGFDAMSERTKAVYEELLK